MESVCLLDFHDLLVTEITKFIDHGYLELYGSLAVIMIITEDFTFLCIGVNSQ